MLKKKHFYRVNFTKLSADKYVGIIADKHVGFINGKKISVHVSAFLT